MTEQTIPHIPRALLTPERVQDALDRTETVTDAADLLGVHRVSLYRFMRSHGLRLEKARRRIVAD